MRVFVPMNDEWFSDPRFKEVLVPYRCGVRLLPQLVARRDDASGATLWEMPGPLEAA